MKDNVNILCLKGFVNIDKINKNYVYINKNNELTALSGVLLTTLNINFYPFENAAQSY